MNTFRSLGALALALSALLVFERRAVAATWPFQFVKVSGDQQTYLNGAPLESPLVVALTDSGGEPIVNAPVTFTVRSGGGFVATVTTTTDVQGRAQTGYTLASGNGGTNVIVATTIAGLSVTFTEYVMTDTLGFPDATTTGVPAGTTLTPSGNIVVTVDGTVIDARDVQGKIEVNANNVTIKRTRVAAAGCMAIQNHGRNLVVQDCEVFGLDPGVTAAIDGGDYTAQRVHIHDTVDGLKVSENTTIQDCYIHDLWKVGIPKDGGTHNDCMQANSGCNNITIRHCNISNAHHGNSCLFFAGGTEASNITVDGNLINGGGFCITFNSGTNRAITNNLFGRDYGVHLFRSQSPVTWSGNLWADTLQPANPRD